MGPASRINALCSLYTWDSVGLQITEQGQRQINKSKYVEFDPLMATVCLSQCADV